MENSFYQKEIDDSHVQSITLYHPYQLKHKISHNVQGQC